MKKQNISPLAEASTKFNLNPVNFQFDLPMLVSPVSSKPASRGRFKTGHSEVWIS